MAFTVFDILPIRGFWKKQYLEDEYIGMKLIVGIFGMLIGFWMITIPILVDVMIGLFISLQDINIPQFLYFLSSFQIHFWIGIVVSAIATYLTLNFSELFLDWDLKKHYKEMKIDLMSSIDELDMNYKNARINIIWTLLLINGFISGIIYSIIYFVPLFVIFVLVSFILFNFLPSITISFVIGTVLAWVLTASYIIRRKLDLSEKETIEKPVIQRFTKRDVEILSSEEEPIICENCRSFIPADSKICPVCSEDVEPYNP